MAKPLPDFGLPWPIPMPAVALIAEQEGLMLKAYRCPAGVWTIGWGETDGVKPGDVCTKEQADRWLCDDLIDRTRAVKEACTEWPNDNQLGALVSLAYNIGLEGLRKSTVLRCHNARDFDAAARAFGLWNKARDPQTKQLVVLRGLTARRAAEMAMYLEPDDERDAWKSMPQAVEAESSLAASPMAQSGAVSLGTGGVVTAAAAFGDQVKPVIDRAKEFAGTLGVTPLQALATVLIVVGAVMLYQRYKQRSQGWA